MYIKTLRLQNIKCFEDTTFSFTTEDGNIAKWVTLLGENSTGKTTALQALAILVAGVDQAPSLLPRPIFWLRDESKFGHITYMSVKANHEEVLATCLVTGSYKLESPTLKSDDNRSISYETPSFCEPNIQYSGPPIDLWKLNPSHPEYDPTYQAPTFHIETWPGFPFKLAAAYGPFRRLSRREALPSPLSKPERYTNFTSLFGEEDGIATFELWIWFLDNQAAKGDSTARHKLDAALRALTELLPDEVVFDREALDKRSEVRFLVQNTSIPTYALSDGYRSILALGGDLLWRLLNAYPESDTPTHEEGVVLIDELDIHLHPRWQSWIAQKLRSVFPNIQFIVATHSPLVAMGAYWDGETGERRDDVLTLKLEINDGKASVQRIDDDLAAMDINRALESPAFGMVAPRPPQVEEKIDRYDELLEKERRTQAEEAELQKLQQFMSDVRPIGGKPVPGSFEAKLEDYLREKLG